MPWTKVAKPTGSAYTRLAPVGKQAYDQSDLTYDTAAAFYDSVNTTAYTKVSKPTSSVWSKVSKPT